MPRWRVLASLASTAHQTNDKGDPLQPPATSLTTIRNQLAGNHLGLRCPRSLWSRPPLAAGPGGWLLARRTAAGFGGR